MFIYKCLRLYYSIKKINKSIFVFKYQNMKKIISSVLLISFSILGYSQLNITILQNHPDHKFVIGGGIDPISFTGLPSTMAFRIPISSHPDMNIFFLFHVNIIPITSISILENSIVGLI